jgi:hypothetical protein
MNSLTIERFALACAFLICVVICAGELARTARAQNPSTTFTLTVKTRDTATGRSVPARFYLVDRAGKHWTSPGALEYNKPGENHFIAPGSFQIQVPPGEYKLSAERGPEYRAWTGTVTGQTGQSRTVTVPLARWIDMNHRGWYSGDLHNHRRADEMPQLLLAEDLNLAPTLTDWIWEDAPVSHPPRTTDAIRSVDATHVYSVLDKEVERLEQGPGAVDLLGLRSTIPFDGYRLYPPNDVYCALAHAQGGYVDAEKIVWRDTAALVALKAIDFAGIVNNHFSRGAVELETDRWGMIPKERPEFDTIAGMPLWSMEVYYRFLNCGFRLPVSAGSASGVKASPLGYNRVYVRLHEPFSYEGWFRALKAGRSFATNGPMLFLTVNGQDPGATLSAPARLRIRAEASSAGRLDRLEILFGGKVIKSVPAHASSRAAVDFEYEPQESGWVAARCFEQPGATIRFAHTGPVYVQSEKARDATADAQFFLDWIDREIRFYKAAEGFRSPAHREAMLSFFAKARAVYAKLARPF